MKDIFAKYTELEKTKEFEPKVEAPPIQIHEVPYRSNTYFNSMNLYLLDPPEVVEEPKLKQLKLSFKEMVDKYGNGLIKVSNWHLRDKNAKFGVKNSWHKQAHETWKNEDGTPMPKAFDLTPDNGASFDDLRKLLTTPIWKNWLEENGMGIIDEANGLKRSWKASGAHLHLGPDDLARKEYTKLLTKYAKHGGILKALNGLFVTYTEQDKKPKYDEIQLTPSYTETPEYQEDSIQLEPSEFNNDSIELTPQENIQNSQETSSLQDYAKQRLSELGLLPYQVAGFLGNLDHESGGWNTSALGDHGTSYGLAQWHNDRMKKLFNFSGTNKPTGKQQIDYLIHELQGDYAGVLYKLRKAKDVKEATKIAMNEYEKPNAKYAQFENRLTKAYKYV